VNIHTLRCRNRNVFDYGVLPQTPLGMSHNRRYMHSITFLQSEKFRIPKHIWPQEFRIRDCKPILFLQLHFLQRLPTVTVSTGFCGYANALEMFRSATISCLAFHRNIKVLKVRTALNEKKYMYFKKVGANIRITFLSKHFCLHAHLREYICSSLKIKNKLYN
jgi:hypothetical protein